MSARRPATTLFILAAYLLAVTAGGWFHLHGHAGDGAPEACAHDDGGRSGLGHPSGSSPAPVDRAPGGSHDPDSCPVCHFLAQQPVPAERIEAVTSAALPGEVAPAAPAPICVDVPSVHHSRAPPRAA